MVIAFKGMIDGEPFEGGTGDDTPVLIGSGTFIPGFEDQLLGIKTGEARTFDIKFPDNYHAPRGRQARHLRGDGEIGRGARNGYDRRGLRQVARS